MRLSPFSPVRIWGSSLWESKSGSKEERGDRTHRRTLDDNGTVWKEWRKGGKRASTHSVQVADLLWDTRATTIHENEVCREGGMKKVIIPDRSVMKKEEHPPKFTVSPDIPLLFSSLFSLHAPTSLDSQVGEPVSRRVLAERINKVSTKWGGIKLDVLWMINERDEERRKIRVFTQIQYLAP